MDKQSEHDYITKILAGDSDQFEFLVQRFKDRLYIHCYNIVLDADAAEDIAQDTFVKAYYSLNKYKPEYRFSTWLYAIATRKCYDQLRSRKFHLDVDSIELGESSDQSMESSIDRQLTNEMLRNALKKLPPKQYIATSMFYFQAKKIEEIAEHMETTPGSVKGWLFRSKKSLRKELQR